MIPPTKNSLPLWGSRLINSVELPKICLKLSFPTFELLKKKTKLKKKVFISNQTCLIQEAPTANE